MCDNFFKDLCAFVEEKNKEKSEKEKNKKDKKEGNFYKKFRQYFSKEVRYNKIKIYGEQNLPKKYQYMIGLSKPPKKIKMSELSVSIPDIIKNLPEDFKKVYDSTKLETKLADLEVKRAGFSFLTSALTNKEGFSEIKKLMKLIDVEFPNSFGLNDYDKFSNFVKSKLEYKKDKEAIEKLEEPFQDAIKAIKELINAFEKECNKQYLLPEDKKTTFEPIFKKLIENLVSLSNPDVISRNKQFSSINNALIELSKKTTNFIDPLCKLDKDKEKFTKPELDNFSNISNQPVLLVNDIISIIKYADDILSNVYNIIIKISGDNEGNKQNVYYECARQINEIKNQIIKKMNDDYNKVDNNKKTAFIFICANLKLEYQYLIEKDKSKEGKIDTTKFESDSVSKIWSDFNDRTKRLTFQERYNMKMKFSSKTTEKYDYIPHKKPLFLPKLIFFNGEPNISDIKQGDIGDCYLLAALQNLVGNSQGKEAIEKVFLNKDTAGKDEYVKMRFFKLKFTKKDGLTCIEPSGEKTIIKINTELLVKGIDQKIEEENKAYNKTVGSCWVDCFEKAFAVYRHDKTNVVVDEQCKEDKKELENLANSWNSELSLKLSSENISGGHSMIPLAAITGNPYFTFSNDGKKDEKGMYNFFKDNTSNKVINFKKNEIKKISNIGNHLYSTHAYSVLEVYEDKNKIRMIKLKNPHNSDGIDLSEALSISGKDEKKDGEIVFDASTVKKVENGMVTMRFDVFCKLLNEVEFG